MDWTKWWKIGGMALLVWGSVRCDAALKPEDGVLPEGVRWAIVVSDVHGFIHRTGTISEEMDPILDVDMWYSLFGEKFGDPELSGIATNRGVAVVGMDSNTVFAVVELGEEQVENYTQVLTHIGLQTHYRDGLLVVGKDRDDVAIGVKREDTIRSTLLVKRAPELLFGIHPPEEPEARKHFFERFGGRFFGDAVLSGIAQAESHKMGRLGRIGLRTLVMSTLPQIKELICTAAPEKEGVMLTMQLVTLPDSPVNKVLGKQVSGGRNERLRSGIFTEPILLADFMNPNLEAWTEYVNSQITNVCAAMEIDDAQVDRWTDYLLFCSKVYKGNGCCAMTQDDGSGSVFFHFLAEIEDEEAAKKMIQHTEVVWDQLGLFSLFEQLNMPITFDYQEAVREHEFVPIDVLRIGAGGEFSLEIEVALLNKTLVATSGGGIMDQIIEYLQDASKEPAPNKARRIFENKGVLLADIYPGQWMAQLAPLYGNDEHLSFYNKMLSETDPVTTAINLSDDTIIWKFMLPKESVAKLVQSPLLMQVRAMEQAQESRPVTP